MPISPIEGIDTMSDYTLSRHALALLREARVVRSARDIKGGWYVYVYVENPVFDDCGRYVDGVPVYAGKGIDNRAFQHSTKAGPVNRGEKSENAWYYKIAEMLREKTPYAVVVLIEGVKETAAYNFEKHVIEVIGRRNIGTGPLYNLTEGGEGLTSERSLAMRNSPNRKLALAKAQAKPEYRAKIRAAQIRIQNDPEIRTREAATRRENRARKRAALVFVLAYLTKPADLDCLIEEFKKKQKGLGRLGWNKDKDRKNARRRELYAQRPYYQESKQAAIRRTAEGKRERNAKERLRRQRKREAVLGLDPGTIANINGELS
jgi:hypothetical protein